MLIAPSLDNTNPLGPALVAASALPDPQNVSLKCIVNGNTLQNGSTAYAL